MNAHPWKSFCTKCGSELHGKPLVPHTDVECLEALRAQTVHVPNHGNMVPKAMYDRVRNALLKYGRHLPNCFSYKCRCGWNDIAKELTT